MFYHISLMDVAQKSPTQNRIALGNSLKDLFTHPNFRHDFTNLYFNPSQWSNLCTFSSESKIRLSKCLHLLVIVEARIAAHQLDPIFFEYILSSLNLPSFSFAKIIELGLFHGATTFEEIEDLGGDKGFSQLELKVIASFIGVNYELSAAQLALAYGFEV